MATPKRKINLFYLFWVSVETKDNIFYKLSTVLTIGSSSPGQIPTFFQKHSQISLSGINLHLLIYRFVHSFNKLLKTCCVGCMPFVTPADETSFRSIFTLSCSLLTIPTSLGGTWHWEMLGAHSPVLAWR